MDAYLGPALAIAAYLLGSVSFGLVIAARRGVDLRAVGSGNVGATNVGRALGKQTGRLVLALDALKGLLPALAARLLLGPDDPWTAATGVAAVIGHILPLWHRFRGGKGAATAAGVMLAAVPIAGVGSLSGALAGTVVSLGLHGWGWPAAMAAAILAVIVVRHASNIGRLLRGQEPPS